MSTPDDQHPADSPNDDLRDLDCQQASHLISTALDHPLPPNEVRKLLYHYTICRTCRHVRDQFGFMHQVLKDLGTEEG